MPKDDVHGAAESAEFVLIDNVFAHAEKVCMHDLDLADVHLSVVAEKEIDHHVTP